MNGLPSDLRSAIDQVERDHQTVVKSTLSPHAAEFVPRFAINPSLNQQPNHGQVLQEQTFPSTSSTNTNSSDLNSGVGLYSDYSYSQPSPSLAHDDNLEQDDFVALSHLRDFMNTISVNPADYDNLLPHLTEMLNHWINEDPDIILYCVVNNIVDRSITNANFRYNGVRLCLHLIKALNVNSSKGPFKTLLLQRCKREHARRSDLAKASDGGSYLRGLAFFVGDLCTKLQDSELIEILPDLLKSLIQQRSVDNVKTTCQVLKLCGQHVDLYLRSIDSPAMNDLFACLEEILQSKDQNSNVQALVKSVIELRERNWTVPATNGFVPQYAENNPYATIQDDSFEDYPDEMVGYDFGPCGDDDNEDVCDAFEEFLRASGQID